MVPKIAKAGRSFKGAATYYLHDKKALTSDRVAFTHTLNLPTDNPELAWKLMANIAMHQDVLKREAGIKATGRKLTKPVYCYSLSWHPDETPDQEHMIAAAQDSLKALGMDTAQAILVAHNDEKHPHIHVIVNRVDMETGKALSDSKDRLKLSEWAESYEREHGRIYCEDRVKNNEERRRGQFVKDEKSLSRSEYRRWQSLKRRLLNKALKDQRDRLWLTQKDVRQQLDSQRNRELARARRHAKEVYRADWRQLYQDQEKQRVALHQQNDKIIGRLRYMLANRKQLGVDGRNRGLLSMAFTAMTDQKGLETALLKTQQRERQIMGKAQHTTLSRSFDTIWDVHRERFETLREEQAAARQNLRDEQSQTRIDEAKRRRGAEGLAEFMRAHFNSGGQKRAPDKALEKKGTSHSFDQASTGKQNDKVDRIRQMRQRRQHDRKRGRGRDGGRGGRGRNRDR